LLELIGKAPNPLADGELLLALRASEHDDSKLLAETLLDDEELQRLSLRRLLPGLGLVESPTFAVELSVRAANGLGRAGSISLDTLAELTPSEIRELPNVGGKAAEELVRAALREWAESYLRSVDREPRPVTPTALAQQDRDRQIDTADLAKAFEEVEAIAGFDVFRRRFLDPDRPSQSTVALEFGVSGSRISQRERGVKAKLSKRLRDSHWPITRAVKTMQDRLGSVALSNELAEAIAGLDPTGRIVSDEHRKALLARLGGYRISGQWALGPDIESLTSAVLSGLIEDGPVDVDFVREPLVRLGIRELLHLPWIISRPGFQIVDGKLKRAETD
jgi:hypothetical protein